MTQPIVTGSYRGAWTTSTAYKPGDVVHFAGTTYVATAASTSGNTFETSHLSHIGACTGDVTAGTVGSGVKIKEGSNAKMGTATDGSATQLGHAVEGDSQVLADERRACGFRPAVLSRSTVRPRLELTVERKSRDEVVAALRVNRRSGPP